MTIPDKEEFTGLGVTEQGFKIAQNQLIDHLKFREKLSLIFDNETLLKVTKPEQSSIKAKVLDTGKVFEWTRTSSEGETPITGNWTDTNSSEYELAEKFTKKQINKVNEKLKYRNGSNILNIYSDEGCLVAKIDANGDLFLPNLASSVQNEVGKILTNLLGLNKTTISKPSSKIFTIKDAQQHSVLEINKNGDLKIAGLNGSVQDVLNSALDTIRENSGTAHRRNKKRALSEYKDANGCVYASFDMDANLILTGLNVGLQDLMLSAPLNSKPSIEHRDTRYIIADDCIKYVTSLQTGGLIAPIPFSAIKLSWVPEAECVNAKTVQGVKIPLKTPYSEDDGVVHPYIFETRNGFLGYRYILGITPFKDAQDKYENPCIYGSNDLAQFDLISKITQPFEERPLNPSESITSVYNSDPFFTYDYHSGELIFGWRPCIPHAAIHISRTKNGLEWSPIESIFEYSTEASVLSPSIIYNFETKMYELWCVEGYNPAGGGLAICKYTSKSLKNPKWNGREYYNRPVGSRAWHLDVRYIGNKVMALLHDDFQSGDGSTENIYIGMLGGDSFTWGDSGVLTGDFLSPYKATFTPLLNENNTFAFYFFWTSRKGSSDKIWRLYGGKSQNFNLVEI